MTLRRSPFVLFAAAAGPELGFGHLVRCGVLAGALGVTRELALRGTVTGRLAALRFGWTVHAGPGLVDALLPDLIVVDDPSPVHRARWIRFARDARIPVAAIFDGGSEHADADLIIDGSFTARPDHRQQRYAGPAWAILPTTIEARRRRPIVRDRRKVLVALGGGVHVQRLGVSIAQAIVARMPEVRVELAAGFTGGGSRLPRRCAWVHAPFGLTDHLASCGISVVAGGVTMYEACALGTPSVAIPVVGAQRPAIDAAAAAGAVVTVESRVDRSRPVTSVAETVRALLETPGRAAALAATASGLVDGGGAPRAAARLRDLVRAYERGGRHAA